MFLAVFIIKRKLCQKTIKIKKNKELSKKRLFAANGIIRGIVNEKNANKLAEDLEPIMKGSAGIAIALGAASAKADHENIRKFADKSNRGKKPNVILKEKNEIVKDKVEVSKNNELQNVRNFVANKKKINGKSSRRKKSNDSRRCKARLFKSRCS